MRGVGSAFGDRFGAEVWTYKRGLGFGSDFGVVLHGVVTNLPHMDIPSLPSSHTLSSILAPISSPTNPLVMSIMPPMIGCAAMLALGSKKAPPTFDGDELQIAEFLEIYECCIDDAQLPQADWVPFFFRYLSRSQRDIFEVFEGVELANWGAFEAAIHESFAGAFKTKKYTLTSLDNFIKLSARNPILSDMALCAYH